MPVPPYKNKAKNEISALRDLAERGPFRAEPRQHKRMERDAGALATDYSFDYVRQFVGAGIGVVFVYTSDAPEWGSGHVRYALGPKGSTTAQVRALLDDRYGGDDWKWTIQRVSSPAKTAKNGTEGSGRQTLRRAVRRDR